MMVIAKLDKLGPNGDGTYYCEQRLEVGLNIGNFHEALNAGVQGVNFLNRARSWRVLFFLWHDAQSNWHLLISSCITLIDLPLVYKSETDLYFVFASKWSKSNAT